MKVTKCHKKVLRRVITRGQDPKREDAAALSSATQSLTAESCPAQRSSLCGTSASRIAVPPLSFPRLSSSDWLPWRGERGWGCFPRVFLVTGGSQWVLLCLGPCLVKHEERLASR